MYTSEQLAQVIEGTLVGSREVPITGFAPADRATEGDITFLAFPRYLPAIRKSRAGCVIVGAEIRDLEKTQIVVKHPYYAFVQVVQLFEGGAVQPSPGISPKADISNHVTIGRDPSISPFVSIEEGVKIGDRVQIFPGAYIGRNCEIGDDVLIYSNVTIREKSRIGNRVIIQDGAVIGSDGFGFVTLEGRHQKIPQVGVAVIEDDVSIGANVTIDRATFGETRVKCGTKIDDQVHLGHNVTVGRHGLFAAQTGISGSVTIGDFPVVGGQTGMAGHLRIGDHVKIAAKSGLTRDIPDHETIAGFPAVGHMEWKRSVVLIRELSKMEKRIQDLEKKIKILEENNGKEI